MSATKPITQPTFDPQYIWFLTIFAFCLLQGGLLFVQIWKRRHALHAFKWKNGITEASEYATIRPELVTTLEEKRYESVEGEEKILNMVKMGLGIPKSDKSVDEMIKCDLKRRNEVYYVPAKPLVVALGWITLVLFTALSAGLTYGSNYFRQALITGQITLFPPNTSNTLASIIPATISAILIPLIAKTYEVVSFKITLAEWHRTDAAFEKAQAIKTTIFTFFNANNILFFIAFWLADWDYLRVQVGSLLIAGQIVGNFREVILPYLKGLLRKWQEQRLKTKRLKLIAKTAQTAARLSLAAHGVTTPSATIANVKQTVGKVRRVVQLFKSWKAGHKAEAALEAGTELASPLPSPSSPTSPIPSPIRGVLGVAGRILRRKRARGGGEGAGAGDGDGDGEGEGDYEYDVDFEQEELAQHAALVGTAKTTQTMNNVYRTFMPRPIYPQDIIRMEQELEKIGGSERFVVLQEQLVMHAQKYADGEAPTKAIDVYIPLARLSMLSNMMLQAHRPEPEKITGEYIEMLVQFGYICMFAIAFPLGCLMCFVNNIIEIRIDATKLTKLSRMTPPRFDLTIEVWNFGFILVAGISVLTNLAILYRTQISLGGTREDNITRISPAALLLNESSNSFITLLLLVGLEHAFGLTALFISFSSNKRSTAVSRDLYRQEYYDRLLEEEEEHRLADEFFVQMNMGSLAALPDENENEKKVAHVASVVDETVPEKNDLQGDLGGIVGEESVLEVAPDEVPQ